MFYLLWLQPVRLDIKEQGTVWVSVIKSQRIDLFTSQIIWLLGIQFFFLIINTT